MCTAYALHLLIRKSLEKKVIIPRFYKKKKALPLERPDAARRSLDPLINCLRQYQLPVLWVIGLPTRRIIKLRRQYCRALAEGLGFTYLSLDEQLVKWKNRAEEIRDVEKNNSMSTKPRTYNYVDNRFKNSVDVELRTCPSLGLPGTTTGSQRYDSQRYENTAEIYTRRSTNEHKNRITFKIGQRFSREEILEFLKFAMIESMPTKGFVIENFPYDRFDALNFESMFYPVLLGIYLTESDVLKSDNQEKVGGLPQDCSSSRRMPVVTYPEVELVTPKYAKRIKEFSFQEAEVICENYGDKLIRILNAEALLPDTFSFVSTVVENCLETYPSGSWGFDNLPSLYNEYYDSDTPPVKLSTDISVIVRVESVHLSPPPTLTPKSREVIQTRAESSRLSMTEESDGSESDYTKIQPGLHGISPIWVEYSGSSTETEMEFHDGGGDGGRIIKPIKTQTKKNNLGTGQRPAFPGSPIMRKVSKTGESKQDANALHQPGVKLASNKNPNKSIAWLVDLPSSGAEHGDQLTWKSSKTLHELRYSSGNDGCSQYYIGRSTDTSGEEDMAAPEHIIIPPPTQFGDNARIPSCHKDSDEWTDILWEDKGSQQASDDSSATPLTPQPLSHLMAVSHIFGQSSSNEDPESSTRREHSRGRSRIRRLPRLTKDYDPKLLSSGDQRQDQNVGAYTSHFQPKGAQGKVQSKDGYPEQPNLNQPHLFKRHTPTQRMTGNYCATTTTRKDLKIPPFHPSCPNLLDRGENSKTLRDNKNTTNNVTESIGYKHHRRVPGRTQVPISGSSSAESFVWEYSASSTSGQNQGSKRKQ